MCTALSKSYLVDRITTAWTGFVNLIVGVKVVLLAAGCAVGLAIPVDAGPFSGNSGFQNFPDGVK